MEAAASSHEALVKMWVFVLVQALVYLILAQSSDVFSRAKSLQGGGAPRRPARSVSAVRRMLAVARGGRRRWPEEGLREERCQCLN
ncbi:hypothetical protein OsI_31572 [Oryza sativa Indica Group]|jgi:formate--tetrahydrofolate ligase|uniref:Uncharacterized protein n=2 Tax=Oryza TaxID=4527 RepID=A0A0E0IKT2_ORYNI|nr:hypothetical protein OsI_31572 [Oryza sativa Indica Group]